MILMGHVNHMILMGHVNHMILMGHVNVALEPYDIDGACECSLGTI